MAISSVSSSGIQQQLAISNAQQTNESARTEREPDNDRDDAAMAAKKAAAAQAPAPTVNTNGQVIGSTINVTA